MIARTGFGVAIATAFSALPSKAWKLDLPHATRSVDLPGDGWTPRPTAPPGGLRPLIKRQINSNDNEDGTTVLIAPDNTCGFISARPGALFACSPTYSCVFFTASAPLTGNVACCDDFQCGARISCIDYDSYYSSSACDDGCRVDAFTVKCMDSAMPYCNTISFADDIYDYWCNSLDISTAQSASTAYSGQTGRQFSPLPLDDPESSLTLEAESEIPGATVTADPTSTDGGDNGDKKDDGDGDNDKGNGNGKDNDNDDDGDNGTPIGPIVGGVVGGIGAIALGGLGLWLFFRKKKKKQAAAAADASAVTSPTMAYAPPHQGPSPGNPQQPFQQPTYYDPSEGGAMGAAYSYAPHQHPQHQHQHPGGFHSMGNTPPPNSVSPTMSYHDGSSPSAVYPSGFTVSPQATDNRNSMANPGVIHEAPSRPEDTQRGGGVHEMA
ncbi:uncharacterized protein F5Z01DRAFT_385953 [Emericellopsis atlantica]|uniref:Uncharacterized protein n=1 Tax=Emericellopsis atlantica TaxID=2614577 RepID=A0A9P7ZSR7_9HYPO|nr:uncharacterized protein F5Z01DRAFT_385953 [Emericellopsis atlantica]KAG9257411.1 hypothetical protein F5Z01DRAFT_385953 [Emericellopsis atlantica]